MPSDRNIGLCTFGLDSPRTTQRSLKARASDYINIKEFGSGLGVGAGHDDDSAFAAFQTWAQDQDEAVHLWLPRTEDGAYYNLTSNTNFLSGIKKVIVSAYGACVNNIYFGGVSVIENNTTSARITTTARGDTTVTLVTTAQYSRFTVGRWVLIAAVDTQGFGYPPNPYFFEYAKVKAINSSTGVVTLDRALRNVYKSTYPNYEPGDGSTANFGGYAIMYALNATWDTDVTVAGLHILSTGQIYCVGRKFTFIDITCDDGVDHDEGITPTGCKEVFLHNYYAPHQIMEIDKFIEYIRLDKVTVDSLYFQSPSPEKCEISGGSQMRALSGTPKNLVARSSDLGQITLAPIGYGRSESQYLENCRVKSIAAGSANRKDLADFTLSHGTLSLTLGGNSCPIPWMMPGTRGYLSASNDYNYGIPFVITDLRQSGTGAGSTIYVDTTLPHTIPTFTGTDITQPTRVVQHPASRLTVRSCTGCDDIVSLSRADPDLPLYSHQHRLFTGNIGFTGEDANFLIWGWIVSIRINVIRAYTGVASSVPLAILGKYGTYVIDAAYDQSRPVPTINLKVAGERIITPAAVTGTQSGDSGLTLGTKWIASSCGCNLDVDVSGEAQDKWAIVEVEYKTNQGITGVHAFVNGSSHLY